MNLTLFFRLIVMSLFQRSVKRTNRSSHGDKMCYDNTYFYCPQVYAKDGFNVSLQISNGHYCQSENGYRMLGHTWKEVEFGYPSEMDDILKEYAEDPETAATVGEIPIEKLEALFEKHGGVDWDKTISIESFNTLIN